MLNQIIVRLICALISATVLSIIGDRISSKLWGVPRILRDGGFSGADQKRGKRSKRDHLEPTDGKAIGASKRSRKESRSRHINSNNQGSQSQSKADQNRCKGPGEMKGQPKFQRQCHNRSGRILPDANVKDRAFSQRRNKGN
jgi:hypothetical protein